ncbi:HAD family hydrolase [Pelagibius marinus]|uniref:HAD family hydrolase n=1 Tax=Pelagibius marinus TaxID=2762760 RepID=UPI0018726271|nr:HAD family phosphatase [Pelagibius marinus]
MDHADCIIFDMDDVLCRYDFTRRMDIMAEGLGIQAETIVARIYDSGLDERADAGEFTAETYLAALTRELKVEVPLELWLRARRESMRAIPEVLELARRLGRKHTVAMLTNNGDLLRRHIAMVFPEALEVFGERAYFSCQFGAAKPQPEVFLSLLGRLGHAPRDALFIDDTSEYVAGAREAGLQAHLFTGYEALPSWLKEMA